MGDFMIFIIGFVVAVWIIGSVLHAIEGEN